MIGNFSQALPNNLHQFVTNSFIILKNVDNLTKSLFFRANYGKVLVMNPSLMLSTMMHEMTITSLSRFEPGNYLKEWSLP